MKTHNNSFEKLKDSIQNASIDIQTKSRKNKLNSINIHSKPCKIMNKSTIESKSISNIF